MKYATEIMKNSLYKSTVEEIEELEADRIYCRHGMPHIMDVCRLAWSLYLEETPDNGNRAETMEQMKDRIFVAGLLHDIGRACQYKTGGDGPDLLPEAPWRAALFCRLPLQVYPAYHD